MTCDKRRRREVGTRSSSSPPLWDPVFWVEQLSTSEQLVDRVFDVVLSKSLTKQQRVAFLGLQATRHLESTGKISHWNAVDRLTLLNDPRMVDAIMLAWEKP